MSSNIVNYNQSPYPFLLTSLSIQETSSQKSQVDLEHSKVLNELEKKYYSQMIECVASYGIENNLELFNAAGYCFDMHFGLPNQPNNIITIENYLAVMGEDVKKTLGENTDITSDFFAHDRPGFFILRPDGQIFFLKEGPDKSLLYYNACDDSFQDSSAIEIDGKEKLVILNKTSFPLLETNYSHPTPNGPVDGKFYHEKQDGVKCTIHAVHAFLGFPVINQTQVSLSYLEKLTELCWSEHVNHPHPNSLPLGQINYYKSITRFEYAQTSLFQADLGIDTYEILKLIQLMARQGTIDNKFWRTEMYGIHIGARDIEYAIIKGFASKDQVWDESLTRRVIEAAREDLEKDRVQLDDLDFKISQLENIVKNNQLHPRFDEYMDLSIERTPYDILEHRIERLNNTLQGLQKLKTMFAKTDRLIVLSHNEVHCFTMRKFDENSWAVIDSLDNRQPLLNDPSSWLQERMQAFFRVQGSLMYEFITL